MKSFLLAIGVNSLAVLITVFVTLGSLALFIVPKAIKLKAASLL